MKKEETYLNQDPFDAAMARWERRLNIIAWGILGFTVSYFGPIVIDIFLKH